MINKPFKLVSPYGPTGDQPTAIAQLSDGFSDGAHSQILLGVTGSGKTFTMANIINQLQRPTLILAHNKTLAAQLFAEFREFFPENAVQYFVSYYDYYQPEAYIPLTDTYIEKDSNINEEIEKFRHASTHAILTRRDTIIVASVSCIYGLGSPEVYRSANLTFTVGENIARNLLTRRLTDLQYERNDVDLRRGRFRVRGDSITIFPAYDDTMVKLVQFGDEVEAIYLVDPVTQQHIQQVDSFELFPAKHYLTQDLHRADILKLMEEDMLREVAQFEAAGKHIEAQRLKQRVRFDIDMIRETGTCSGIENYSRYFDQRTGGTPPSVLLDYFPQDYLLFVDESHMTIPQIGGMFNGDQARKQTLIDYGFRLQAAKDNRPLRFSEFEERAGQTLYVSATPGPFELNKVKTESQQRRIEEKRVTNLVAEQLVRPTGITDPILEVRPIQGQIDNLLAEIKTRVAGGERTLVTTLTKRMAEDITEFMLEKGIKVQYLHSDVKTMDRSTILQELRAGVYDVLVGINLLREGLDLPEVSLVAILDADKEGFLRSETSLIQTIGRAARHLEGKVILYADRITGSMQRAMEETERRRAKQVAYNTLHGITPTKLDKPIVITLPKQEDLDAAEESVRFAHMPREEQSAYLEELKERMRVAAENLNFEEASKLRDTIRELRGK